MGVRCAVWLPLLKSEYFILNSSALGKNLFPHSKERCVYLDILLSSIVYYDWALGHTALYVALSCPIEQCSIWEAFLCSGRCTARCETLVFLLCIDNLYLASFLCTLFLETVTLIIQNLYLILGAGTNYAWFASQYSLYLALIFPVRAAGKFSVYKDFMLCQVFSHPMLKDAIFKGQFI